MQKLYVGCALTHAPEEFKNAVEALKKTLGAEFEVLDFLGLSKGTPQDVFEWDIDHCVASCDLFLAICDLPSLGLGYEVATALEKHNTPVLAVAHKDALVARVITGNTRPKFRFQRYESVDEIRALLLAFAKEHL
ncbi:MAG: hypothetical protein WA021_00815 [Minisyncoccia bacterium]